jgi:glycosyltransferase involved in cell wall biosynthesis
MLHGAPIAASRCGGTESTLVHRESGYLFGARDVGALIEATGTLLDDRALAQRLGARAAQVARAKFGWPDIAARIAALYDSLS